MVESVIDDTDDEDEHDVDFLPYDDEEGCLCVPSRGAARGRSRASLGTLIVGGFLRRRCKLAAM
jgi:hypothetical protein